MPEDNLSEGNEDATIADRLANLGEEPEGAADEGQQGPQPAPESEEVVPASEPKEEAEQGAEESTKEETTQQQESEESEEETQLPEGANPRTQKAFERLLDNNRKLKEQLDQQGNETNQQQGNEANVPEGTSVFDDVYGRAGADQNMAQQQPVTQQGVQQLTDSNQYQNLNQNQVNSIAQQFMQQDPDTGETTVNAEGLVNALLQENQRVMQQAESKTRQAIERYEEKEQVREAHSAYPHLAPKDESGNNNPNFDRRFYDLVRVHMYDNLIEGSPKSFKQVADYVAQNVYNPGESNVNVAKEREEAVKKERSRQETRKQARPAQRGKAQRDKSAAARQELRQRTRSGSARESEQAILERLENAEGG